MDETWAVWITWAAERSARGVKLPSSLDHGKNSSEGGAALNISKSAGCHTSKKQWDGSKALEGSETGMEV